MSVAINTVSAADIVLPDDAPSTKIATPPAARIDIDAVLHDVSLLLNESGPLTAASRSFSR